MINLPFKINGKDFSHLVHKYGYKTGRVPVIAKTITDLGGTDHEFISRWRSTLTVTLNASTEAKAIELATELMQREINITYHNFQLGQTVTESMGCVPLSDALALVSGGVRYLEGKSIQFRQR